MYTDRHGQEYRGQGSAEEQGSTGSGGDQGSSSYDRTRS